MKTITVTRCLHVLCGGLAAWGLSPLADAQDVEIFGVIKNQQFVQESAKIVRLAPDDNGALEFECFVDVAEGETVNSATVTPPGGTAITLQSEGGGAEFRDAKEALLELNASYPDGSYSFAIQTGSGSISTTLSLSGNTYPNVPWISNYAAAQSIVAGNNFTVQWDTFTSGTAEDFVEFAIEDGTGNEIFHSGPPGLGLNGTHTSVAIPAGTLESGKIYHARLMFAKIAQMRTDVPGATMAVAAYTKTTELEIRTAGSLDDSIYPSLVEMWPRPWNGEVPVRSVMAFRFSEVMAQGTLALVWSGSGLNPALFSYQWSGDGNVLYAIYNNASGLPADTEISWVLNITDLAGNALPQQSDSFTTSTEAASMESDVAEALLVKNQIFMQNAGGTQAAGLCMVELDVPLNHRNALPSGSITTPAPLSGVAQLDTDLDDDDSGYEALYASKEDMDHFFPSGDYGIVLNTAHDGTKSATLNFPADAYPNDPTVSSFAALQTINSTQPLTISWTGFSGGTSNDVIILEIESEGEDIVFETPGPGEPGALTGLSTSIEIPANTLSPGRTYQAFLIFAKLVDTDVSSGVQMAAVFAKTTLFEMTTSGERIQPKATPVPGPGSFQVLVTGDRHVSYAMEASTNFTKWYEISYPQATGDGNQITLEDWNSSMFKKRFYRVREISNEEFYQRPVAIQGMVVNSQNGQPVAGAVISTSLDGNTATSDADGLFFLQTGITDINGQTQYSVTVSKSGFHTLFANWYQGNQPRNQWFNLQPQ